MSWLFSFWIMHRMHPIEIKTIEKIDNWVGNLRYSCFLYPTPNYSACAFGRISQASRAGAHSCHTMGVSHVCSLFLLTLARSWPILLVWDLFYKALEKYWVFTFRKFLNHFMKLSFWARIGKSVNHSFKPQKAMNMTGYREPEFLYLISCAWACLFSFR